MTTSYNIELTVRENVEKNLPREIYERSVQQFEEAGLVGRMHSRGNFGRMHEGYDESCETYLKGHFDIFYRGDRRTLRQRLDEARITTSGFDETKQKALAMGEIAIDILEQFDPLASLPINVYHNMPFIGSMEVNTAAGIQSTHVHCKDCRIIQFWKPKNDEYWYDHDMFKDYISDLQLEDFKEPIVDSKGRVIGRNIIQRLLRRRKEKRIELGMRAVTNPDSVDKIDWRE